ncbi:hypothetical protein F53441_13796 [Fusarium austroafricanum]|uniref:Uncharacterized protein n=1 Tax=Fusarium austroafricanum TaxID=2364996 RepID=A0A8H4JMA6_9HYPO|nr:hypothetical protein F53441_13796 [Fusarium austroafricanum]
MISKDDCSNASKKYNLHGLYDHLHPRQEAENQRLVAEVNIAGQPCYVHIIAIAVLIIILANTGPAAKHLRIAWAFLTIPTATFDIQAKTLLLAPLLAAGVVSAATQKTTSFEAIALRSGSETHFDTLQASKGSIALDPTKQGTSCDKGNDDSHAVFNLIGDKLYVYKTGHPPQLGIGRKFSLHNTQRIDAGTVGGS